MIAGLKQRISALAGQLCTGLCHMSSSWGLEVVRAQLQDGQKLVVKTGVPDLAGQLECEGNMLKDLGKAGLPVPQVFHTGKDMLIMEWIETAPG
ncbi:MAG TPA: hypothetical protein ENJ99_00210, partial [Rhizobiales bacterium]|nr:hypothetical protein [Hyphomicrobiales bacterium]